MQYRGPYDKDKIIALQRKKIEELSKKVSALEQEVALLNRQKMIQKKGKRCPDL